MSQTATAEDVIPAVFPATPENRYRALQILKDQAPPEPIDGPLLVTMGESAELLGVSRATLWRMVRAGRLTKVEIYTNAYRLRRSDIIGLVNGSPKGGTSC